MMTTFVTPYKTFFFAVMSVSLMNAAISFQQTMDVVLQDIQFPRVHIGDVFIFSKFTAEHVNH